MSTSDLRKATGGGQIGGAASWLGPGLLLAATLLRLLAARAIPLSPDEAYYWLWSKALAPGYYDHPPMVALWIWAGTHLAGDTELGVRLLGPLSAALGSLLLVQAGRDLAPGSRAGARAAWLLNATLALNAGSIILTPDTPLLLFWTASLAAAARLQRTQNLLWFLALGIAAGLALLSKYTAVLLAPALAVWLLAARERRQWLKSWQIWAGLALAAAIFAPVVLWNGAHRFVSFAKQGGRVGAFDPHRAAQFMAELLGGQLGLATPILLGLFAAGTLACLRAWRQPGPCLLACLVLLPASVFVFHALGDRVQANWPAILYPAAALAAGLNLAPGRGWRVPGWALGVGMSCLVLLQAALAPLPLPRMFDPTLIRLAGWRELAQKAAAAAHAQGAVTLAADEYGLASELAFYQPMPVLAAEPRWAYFALPDLPVAGPVLLVQSTRSQPPNPALWPGLHAAAMLDRSRGGVLAESYAGLLQQAPKAGPVAALPARLLPH